MPNLNQVNLIGHLTREPELRYTPKGTAVVEIALAINREWKTEAGEKKFEVAFVDVTAWARLAEVIGQYLHKGSPVFITGRLSLESWVDKSTQQKRQKLVVVADGMQLLGSKPSTGEDQPGQSQRTAPPAHTPSRPSRPELLPTEPDDEIPF